jgi:uncharacterized DUF497 family protein
MPVRFTWDEHKNRANIVKHRVGFDEASKVFSDPQVIIREDCNVAGEQRARHRLCRAGFAGRAHVPGRRPRRDHPDYLSAQSNTRGEEAL